MKSKILLLILFDVILGILWGGLPFIVILISMALSIQGIFTLVWMLYAWEDPAEATKRKSPKYYCPPHYSFTALLPARHEELVIQDTIRAIDQIKYPDQLKEVLILCREDDQGTINKARAMIETLGKPNIKLLVFDSLPINKPHGLNIGLNSSTHNIVTIFDAEDEPHPDIYKIVNTVLIRDQTDMVQSGVQLMNYQSHWFSAINVLEYFFWFKSGLHLFSRIGRVTPLGGNTVFFKKEFLKRVGGWDEECLTEDADIGIRLVKAGAKVSVVYDERHVTREETPDSTAAFIKQRTRWDHGFLQILFKTDWRELPQLRQQAMAFYTLATPLFQAAILLYLPFGMWLAMHHKLPVAVSMVTFLPTYIFLFQIIVYAVGIREFAKLYKLDYSLWDSIKILAAYFPYQFILVTASTRAVIRFLRKNNNWEKTTHINTHRAAVPHFVPTFNYAN